jgi:hypothetical protein
MTSSERFPRVPVSWGELIDKITILEIKAERLRAPEAEANARAELTLLLEVLAGPPAPPAELAKLKAALGAVNVRLWDIEDAIRRKEASQAFDAAFIELARSVYRTNDERSRIKRQINELMRSGIVEEKQYDPY